MLIAEKLAPVFALIDCDAFYANTQRVFRPDLRHTPICVLSNNDGNVIARDAAAKAFIEMGAPYYKIKGLLKAHGIEAFSSNYALYGDMSQRVMCLIESMVPRLEVYSIDEAFADLTGIPGDLEAFGRRLRSRIYKGTGIPVGVGISGTKTLAKLANRAAKRWRKQTGGVVDLRDPERREKLLKAMPVGDVWGVGRRLTERLDAIGIKTAWQLATADPWMIRKNFSIVLEKTMRELGGTPCLSLEEVVQPRQEICCSRAFGHRLREIEPIREAVATYASRACEKLRAQGSLCKQVRVSVRTGMFNPNEPKFARGVIVELPFPSDDTRLIIQAAGQALSQAFRHGHAFAKAEVYLMDLRQKGQFTDDLFAPTQPATSEKVMQVMDRINNKWGRGTLRPGAVPATPDWGMKREMLSQCYTTRINELWTVS